MTLDELLVRLSTQGVHMWADGDQLRLRAPRGAITAQDRDAIRGRKEEILTLLRKKGIAERGTQVPLTRAPRDRPLPLSFAQERLWFLAQLNPESAVYNLPNVFRLVGPLDVDALERSVRALVDRHEILRTTLQRSASEQLTQVVESNPEPAFTVVDLRALPESQREAEALRVAHSDAQEPFDLAQGPLARVTLLELADDHRWLLVTLHHIVSDGWSSVLLLRDLTEFYEAGTAGRAATLPALPVQYADYASWERAWLRGEGLDDELAYWRTTLGGELPVLELPSDRPRPPVATYRGDSLSFEMAPALVGGVKALAHQHGATLFMTVLAVFQVLLHRYTGQTDLIVGAPVAHRTRREIEEVVGCFINTLALRTDLSGNPRFRALLERVRTTCLEAFAHQDLPFEKLVSELHPQRDLSHSPIFQVMLTLHVQDMRNVTELGGVSLTSVEVHNPTSKFDLSLELTETTSGLKCWVEYSTDLFDRATIERFVGHFQTLLTGVVADPDQPIGALPLLSPPERQQLLVEWNATQVAVPAARCLYQLVEDQVARTPEAVAVVSDGETLTYAALNGRANQVARRLQALGVGRETLVGVYLERSVDLLVGLLGIAKAGGAYVPLDPIYPADRIAYILEDAQAAVLLTQQRLVDAVPPGGRSSVSTPTRRSARSVPRTSRPWPAPRISPM